MTTLGASTPLEAGSGGAALPGSCPHCSAAADYSLHHGLHFCNKCGKKVVPVKTSPAPSSSSPTSASGAPLPSPSGAAEAAYTTPPRGANGHAADDADEEEDEVTFKHSMQSPPPAKSVPDYDAGPTPLPPGRSVSHFAAPAAAAENAPAAAAASSAAPAPTAAASTVSAISSSSNTAASAPVASPAAPSDRITLTAAEFADLESSLRAEGRAQAELELEILNTDLEAMARDKKHMEELVTQMSAERDTVAKEKMELTATMDELMSSFDKVVDQANTSKAEWSARLELADKELDLISSERNALKSECEAQKVELETLTASHARLTESHKQLQSEHASQLSLSQQHSAQVDVLQREQQAAVLNLEKVKEKAHAQMDQAREAYLALQRKNAANEQSLAIAQKELAALQESAQASADAALAAQSELAALKSALESAQHSAAESRLQLQESQAVRDAYQKQLMEHRAKERSQAEALERGAQAELDAGRLQGLNQALGDENQKLKSQLFDSFQQEKALKGQLEALANASAGGDGAGGEGAAAAAVLRAAGLDAEVASLKATLLAKENEHKELMNICNDLLSEVETLKAAK